MPARGHAELGSTYPVSGGTARFPFMAFGALGGFAGGWMAFVQAVTIAPIEVEASLGYLQSKFPGTFDVYNSAGTALNGKGIGWGALFMVVFTLINVMGVRWLAETNSVAVYWKIAIPAITIFALIFTSFHTSNFTAGGSGRQSPRWNPRRRSNSIRTWLRSSIRDRTAAARVRG